MTKNKRKYKNKSRELPPGTLPVWFVHTADWTLRKDHYVALNRDVRKDHYVALNRDDALVWQAENFQRGMRVSAAHIMRIRGRWYKVQANNVACYVPVGWNPTDHWLRKALDIEIPEPVRITTHVPKSVAFTFKERFRILFTGFSL